MQAWIKLAKFLSILILPYLTWQIILLYGENGGMLAERLGFSVNIDTAFRGFWSEFTRDAGAFFILLTEPIVQLFGHETFSQRNIMGIVGERGVSIARACLGFGSSIIFISLILAYPAKLKHKLIFGFTGIIVIFILNIIRIVVLTIGQKNFPDSLDFWHHHGFKAMVFGFIFLIWMGFFYVIGKSEKEDEEKGIDAEPVN